MTLELGFGGSPKWREFGLRNGKGGGGGSEGIASGREKDLL